MIMALLAPLFMVQSAQAETETLDGDIETEEIISYVVGVGYQVTYKVNFKTIAGIVYAWDRLIVTSQWQYSGGVWKANVESASRSFWEDSEGQWSHVNHNTSAAGYSSNPITKWTRDYLDAPVLYGAHTGTYKLSCATKPSQVGKFNCSYIKEN